MNGVYHRLGVQCLGLRAAGAGRLLREWVSEILPEGMAERAGPMLCSGERVWGLGLRV